MLTFTTNFRKTKTYNIEEVFIYDFELISVGTYKYQNRPWQSFDYSSALRSAIKGLILSEADTNEIMIMIDESRSIESAVDKITKYMEQKNAIQ